MSTEHESIFGRSWEEVQDRQQGTHRPQLVGPVDASKHAKQIARDIDRYRISVHRDTVERYGIELPEGYVLKEGDLYVYRPNP